MALKLHYLALVMPMKRKFFIAGLILGMFFQAASAFADADLKLRLVTVLPDGVAATAVPFGNEVIFTARYSNAGEGSASGISVTFSFGSSFRHISSSEGCAVVESTLVCSVGMLANSERGERTVTLVPDSAGEFTVAATIEADPAIDGNRDPNTENNIRNASITVAIPAADLQIPAFSSVLPSMIEGGATPVGAEAIFVVSYANAGPGEATGATLKLNFTELFEFVASDPVGCVGSISSVVCDLGPLPAEASGERRITVIPTSVAADFRVDALIVARPRGVREGAQNFDPDLGNNERSVRIVVEEAPPAPRVPSADLQVRLLTPLLRGASPSSIEVGSTISFKANYANAGDGPVTEALLSFDFSGSFEFVSSAPAGCERREETSTVICPLGALASGVSGERRVDVRPLSAGPFSVEAVISAVPAGAREGDPNYDRDPANNSIQSEAMTIVEPPPPPEPEPETPSADLKLTLAADNNSVVVGGRLRYTITINNFGPSEANSIVVADTLTPASPHSAVSSRWTANPAADPTVWTTVALDACRWPADQALSCSLPFALPSGGRAEIFFSATPGAAGSLDNSASVSSGIADPDPANNSATLITPVTPRQPGIPPPGRILSDLALSMIANPNPVSVGSELTYRLSVKNRGPSNAAGVVVTDTLPQGVTYLSSNVSIMPPRREGAIAPCTLGEGGLLTCNIGPMIRGAVVDISVVVKPAGAGLLINLGTVAGATSDSVSANNSVTLKVTAVIAPPPADIKPQLQPDPHAVEHKAAVEEAKPVEKAAVEDATPVGGCQLIRRR